MFTVYRITNSVNEKFYIGVHKTIDPNDDYMGSGRAIRKAIEKYGKNNFKKEILFTFESKNDAYEKERELLDGIWNSNQTYNLTSGGFGSWDHIDTKGLKNPMHVKSIKDKVIATKRKNGSYHSERSKNARRLATLAAAENALGKFHSEETKKKQSIGIKLFFESSINRSLFKEKLKLRGNRLIYNLIDPANNVHKDIDSIAEWCSTNGFPLSSITVRENGDKIKRGKMKGWTVFKRKRNE